MIRMAANFVGDSSDTGITIPKSDTFCREIKYWENDSVVVVNLIFSVAIRIYIGSVFLSTVISFSGRWTCIRALMTRCFAVEWRVSTGLMYFRKSMLATQGVGNLLKVI